MFALLSLLFAGALISNFAIAVIPHEPIVIWFGGQIGCWLTALVATLGTIAACWLDHRVVFPLFGQRLRARAASATDETPLRWIARSPFWAVTLSGLTPLPFWPFKLMIYLSDYPLGRYLAAVALGRIPRYLLLAWIGAALPVPTWAISLLCVGLFAWGLWRKRRTNQDVALEAPSDDGEADATS